MTHPLYLRYPPSRPCACDRCVYFCRRPGWWLVHEARAAIDDGLARRMMLELSPDLSFAVLSPAFRGNEGYFALNAHARNGCTFLERERCALFGKPFQPLECRFCHHDRMGLGAKCHAEIADEWNTSKGKRLVTRWLRMMNLPSHLPGMSLLNEHPCSTRPSDILSPAFPRGEAGD